MKMTFALFAALTLATSLFAVEIGKPAPDFTGTDINGKPVHLSDYKGKIVVLESYNVQCPFCQHHYGTGAMQALQSDLTAKGVVWLVVDSVNKKNFGYVAPEAAQKIWADQKFAATAWIDDNTGTIGHLYGMKTTPHLFVIAADGTLAYAGALDNNPTPEGDPKTAKNYVRNAVDELLAGKPVSITQTKPYGCAVHYAN
ncbi:MAG TPA: redoxin domain-containing protein [Verrucomicrobiae bacterium]|jgi:peroxiredoxin